LHANTPSSEKGSNDIKISLTATVYLYFKYAKNRLTASEAVL